METLSEDEDDIIERAGDSVSVSATYGASHDSDFTPTPGGPFSALTPSMWPQDVMVKLGNPVRHLSRLVGKPTMWFPNRYDTNWSVQAQKKARSLKFWI